MQRCPSRACSGKDKVGGDRATMDSEVSEKHTPGPGKNETQTGAWWSQETVHQLHHHF